MKKIIMSSMLILALFACTKKEVEKSKNIEEIYQENGIPVKTITIQPELYAYSLSFDAILNDFRQSFASAAMGGRIDKIYKKVGDYVHKDEIIMEFPEDAPGGQYKQALAAFELSQKTYERMKNLYEEGGISKQNLDQIETQFKVNTANLDAVSQLLKVRAPIDGYIIDIKVHETDNVRSETVLATISQRKKMKTKIWVTDEEISFIKQNKPVIIRWNDHTFKGKVSQKSLSMDFAHNAFGVDIEFDNSQNICPSGVMGKVEIEIYRNENAFVLPRKVIGKDENGEFVFIAEGDIARKKYVTLGTQREEIEIKKGLESGEEVITKGLNLVEDGVKIKKISESR